MSVIRYSAASCVSVNGMRNASFTHFAPRGTICAAPINNERKTLDVIINKNDV